MAQRQARAPEMLLGLPQVSRSMRPKKTAPGCATELCKQGMFAGHGPGGAQASPPGTAPWRPSLHSTPRLWPRAILTHLCTLPPPPPLSHSSLTHRGPGEGSAWPGVAAQRGLRRASSFPCACCLGRRRTGGRALPAEAKEALLTACHLMLAQKTRGGGGEGGGNVTRHLTAPPPRDDKETAWHFQHAQDRAPASLWAPLSFAKGLESCLLEPGE